MDLLKLIRADVPILFSGAPGIGKTAAITALAKKNNIHLEVLIGSILDPTDIERPFISNNNTVESSAAPWARRLHYSLSQKKECWLFLDELISAPPAIQAAFLRVINERQVGDVSISGCQIIAATNPIEYAANGEIISAATANRFLHIDWVVDPDDWCVGELSNWGKEEVSDNTEMKNKVVSWIKTNPQSLLIPPKENQEEITGWPSPRSWSNVIKCIDSMGCGDKLDQDAKKIIIGLVGAEGYSFFSWIFDSDIPTAKELLDGVKPVPSRADRATLAITVALTYAVKTNRLTDFWKLCETIREDTALRAVSMAIRVLETKKIDFEYNDVKKYLQLKKDYLSNSRGLLN